mmetsp:Transcript_130669/g.230246  ORF Transcript_130669/g.230246 Transcript_130669/m.230246 type:complete len:91 (-) Transcript_130669:767-1039(-)
MLQAVAIVRTAQAKVALQADLGKMSPSLPKECLAGGILCGTMMLGVIPPGVIHDEALGWTKLTPSGLLPPIVCLTCRYQECPRTLAKHRL